jgi:RND superfamily putative drug exporter
MSSWLYRLGRQAYRRRAAVLLGWVLLVVLVGGVAAVAGGSLQNSFVIPGTESQEGLDVLDQRFPQAAGATAQIVYTADDGVVTDADAAAAIEQVVAAVGQVEDVVQVTDPLADDAPGGAVSDDQRYAQSQVQLDAELAALPEDLTDRLEAAATLPADAPVTVELGGQVYQETGVEIGVTELLGVGVAVLVLTVTFGSLLAAGMPLLTALLGVGTAMAGILAASSVATISSTTPTLALMIGLAVGIDYALFVLSRHRHQLAQGMAVEESAARAIATAGTAVVFAGTTVIIALCGLSVVGIPFLSVMGVAAAGAVAVAVLVALTALPALMGLAGERLRPRPGSRAARRELVDPATGGTLGSRWVRVATRLPLLTVAVVVVGVGVLAIPAKDLRLTLPDNGGAPVGSPERTTYDLVAEGFGPGWNAPLLVTADIIASTTPQDAVSGIGAALAGTDGVVAVPVATPNQSADTALFQVIPEGGQAAQSTQDLVAEIRADADDLVAPYPGVRDLLVTGQTAISVDVSQQLGAALLPFGLVVVGLSLVLLLIVFRSVAVPIKATLGYLLSVAAAFGVTAAVFEWGWFADLLNVGLVGPVISFMPIIVMGVLFGLAMDYEVFLVSRMHEEYAHHHDPRGAVTVGFTASARVVTAAATIMIAVFAAFVPQGSDIVKPIALGLAVGVAVDAFAVRMTLVPAVLVLLGHRAWSMPHALERRLPSLDVEGAALAEQLAHQAWVAEHGPAVVRAERVVLATAEAPDRPASRPADLVLRPGGLLGVTSDDPWLVDAFLLAVAGRGGPLTGRLVVLDRPLPGQAGAVAARVALVLPRGPGGEGTVGAAVGAALAARTPGRRGAALRRTLRIADWLLAGDPAAAVGQAPPWFRAAIPLAALGDDERAVLDLALAAGTRPALLVLAPRGRPGARLTGALRLLAGRGATVVVGAALPDAARVVLRPVALPVLAGAEARAGLAGPPARATSPAPAPPPAPGREQDGRARGAHAAGPAVAPAQEGTP